MDKVVHYIGLIKLAYQKIAPPLVFTKKHLTHIDRVRTAAASNRMVTITYTDRKGDTTTRTVEPYKLDGNDFWGYDNEKNNIRRFKVSNITSVRHTKQTYEPKWPVEMQNAGILPPVILFPKSEHDQLQNRLKSGQPIYTTRVNAEAGKYRQGDVLKSEFGHDLVVADVTKLKHVSEHPFLGELKKSQVKTLSKYDNLDLVKLEKKASLYKDEAQALMHGLKGGAILGGVGGFLSDKNHRVRNTILGATGGATVGAGGGLGGSKLKAAIIKATEKNPEGIYVQVAGLKPDQDYQWHKIHPDGRSERLNGFGVQNNKYIEKLDKGNFLKEHFGNKKLKAETNANDVREGFLHETPTNRKDFHGRPIRNIIMVNPGRKGKLKDMDMAELQKVLNDNIDNNMNIKGKAIHDFINRHIEKKASFNYHKTNKKNYNHQPRMKIQGRLVRIENSLKKAVK